MKHFLIYTNTYKDKDLKVTGRIREYLEDRGMRVTVKHTHSEEFRFDESIDCMLVLGGDGTVLQAVREFKEHRVPLIGVNLGTLGYMTEIEAGNLEESLDRLIEGDYGQESRMMLEASAVFADGRTEEGWALNDIVINRTGSLKIISFNVYVNGQFLNSYQADGVIVTTPTGSTGYNLSAGGPIVEPAARLMMVTPICPHTLNQRSIILSPEDVIDIEIPEGKEGSIQKVEASFDAAHTIELKTGEHITVTSSKQSAEFIKLSKVSFLEVLHRKMSG